MLITGEGVHFCSKWVIDDCLLICFEFPKIFITIELDTTGKHSILLFKLQDMFRNNLNSVSADR